jgi:hypothetical protein
MLSFTNTLFILSVVRLKTVMLSVVTPFGSDISKLLMIIDAATISVTTNIMTFTTGNPF